MAAGTPGARRSLVPSFRAGDEVCVVYPRLPELHGRLGRVKHTWNGRDGTTDIGRCFGVAFKGLNRGRAFWLKAEHLVKVRR